MKEEGGSILSTRINETEFHRCFTLGNLIAAAHVCEKNVRWKRQVQKFMMDVGRNCNKLNLELHSGDYQISKATEFIISERGKRREIKAVQFRDRVVQRCLCDNYLTERITNSIIYDNSACQKGKGVTFALRRVKNACERASKESWIVQYDYSSFFQSINHDLVLSSVRTIVEDDKIFDLIEQIVRNEPEGLNLGNQISQMLAILYVNPVDKFISSIDGVSFYHRYMDDGLVICDSKETAVQVLSEIERISSELRLKLNPRKSHINRITSPFVFLKTRFHVKRNRVKMNVRKQQSHRLIRHLRKVSKNPEIENLREIKGGSLGYLNRGDADLTHIVERALC